MNSSFPLLILNISAGRKLNVNKKSEDALMYVQITSCVPEMYLLKYRGWLQ